jgi:hypothetical protein
MRARSLGMLLKAYFRLSGFNPFAIASIVSFESLLSSVFTTQ